MLLKKSLATRVAYILHLQSVSRSVHIYESGVSTWKSSGAQHFNIAFSGDYTAKLIRVDKQIRLCKAGGEITRTEIVGSPGNAWHVTDDALDPQYVGAVIY